MFMPIPVKEFEERTGISQGDFTRGGEITYIVSMRQLAVIEDLRVMPMTYLAQLLHHVPLAEGAGKPYASCEVVTARMDPTSLLVGQTFIERRKYCEFLEKFQRRLAGFCVTRGIAKCTPLIAFGRTGEGRGAIAHYLPPIIEEHGGVLHLLDGMHRNFLVMTVGTTIETIIVRGVRESLPYMPHMWEAVKVVDEKPSKEKRFFDLHPEVFRELKAVGIDG